MSTRKRVLIGIALVTEVLVAGYWSWWLLDYAARRSDVAVTLFYTLAAGAIAAALISDYKAHVAQRDTGATPARHEANAVSVPFAMVMAGGGAGALVYLISQWLA